MDVLVKDVRLAKWELVQSCKGNSPKLHDILLILAKQFFCFVFVLGIVLAKQLVSALLSMPALKIAS